MGKTTRTEEIISDELLAKIEEYRGGTDNLTVAQANALGEDIKALKIEIEAVRSAGADPCEQCGNLPMGIIKTPPYTKDGVDFPAVREVGCVHCWPVLVDREDGAPFSLPDGRDIKVKRRSFSARGLTIKETVDKWNAKQYVEDGYFDRCPVVYEGVQYDPLPKN